MTALRAWIALLAATLFLAGLATGLLVGELRHRSDPPAGSLADYRELLSDRLALDPERERLLHELLRNYEIDVRRVQDRHTARVASAMEPELRALGQRYQNLIRTRLLDPERRERFDLLALENQRPLGP